VALRPLTIAHRAGNSLRALRAAMEAGVDYAETDVWLHAGHIEARHDPRLGSLPLTWARGPRWPRWHRRLLLSQLLAAGQVAFLFDIKGTDERFAQALCEAISAGDASQRAAFTGRWEHMDRVGAVLPGAPRFYTISSASRLAEFRPRLDQRDIPSVSIKSTFLTEQIVWELRHRGVERIITWAVETEEAARRVLGWGVDGVTSDSLPLLASIRAGTLGSGES
jgi:glycerophosphoryl diester phosphodiesterase